MKIINVIYATSTIYGTSTTTLKIDIKIIFLWFVIHKYVKWNLYNTICNRVLLMNALRAMVNEAFNTSIL